MSSTSRRNSPQRTRYRNLSAIDICLMISSMISSNRHADDDAHGDPCSSRGGCGGQRGAASTAQTIMAAPESSQQALILLQGYGGGGGRANVRRVEDMALMGRTMADSGIQRGVINTAAGDSQEANSFQTFGQTSSCLLPQIHDNLSAMLQDMRLENHYRIDDQRNFIEHYSLIRAAALEGPIDPSLVFSDQESQILRMILRERDAQTRVHIVMGVCRNIHEIIKSNSGHQFFVDLLEFCSYRDTKWIVQAVSQNAKLLVKDVRTVCGLSSLQKLMERIIKEETWQILLEKITFSLASREYHMYEILTNANAGKFVKHCLRNLSIQQNMFLYEALWKNCLKLAKNKRGIEALREFILKAPACYPRQKIVELLAINTRHLSMDYFGNYLVQLMLKHEDPRTVMMIIDALRNDIMCLSMNRCGSYVLEKCLESSTGEELGFAILSLGDSDIQQMAQDQFANYVLQKAMKESRSKRWEIQGLLVSAMRRLPQSLSSDPYANKLLKMVK